MALARDANSSGAVAASSLTYNHTCTGSNLVLLVGVNLSSNPGDGDIVTGVTYNSVSMSLITKLNNSDATFTNRWNYLFGLVAPATGTHSVAVSTSSGGTPTIGGVSISYTGAKQSGLPDSFNSQTTASAASLTTSTTVVASNCWLFGVATGTAARPAAGSGFTTSFNDSTGNTLYGDTNGTVGTGSQSMTATQSPNSAITMIVASIAPAPVVTATGSTLLTLGVA